MIPSKSVDERYHTTERKDLVVGWVCPKPPTNTADAMLSLVFSRDLCPAGCHECCAGWEVLALKDCIATVELVSYEWNCHWCKGRLVERIVGKQVERLIGSAND